MRRVVHSKKSSYTPKKMGGFKKNVDPRIPYLGVNNSSISVFESYFIHKILVHPKKFKKFRKKSEKIQKTKKSKKSKKS